MGFGVENEDIEPGGGEAAGLTAVTSLTGRSFNFFLENAKAGSFQSGPSQCGTFSVRDLFSAGLFSAGPFQ